MSASDWIYRLRTDCLTCGTELQCLSVYPERWAASDGSGCLDWRKTVHLPTALHSRDAKSIRIEG